MLENCFEKKVSKHKITMKVTVCCFWERKTKKKQEEGVEAKLQKKEKEN